MEERELRSAKMYFKHQVDIEKFKKETFEKIDIHHNYQAIMEKRRKKRYPKWMLASVASVMIIGAGFTFGGSYIADAAETLINQLFGSKENLMQAYPDESEEEISYFELHMEIAEENLAKDEFNKYSQLYKEQFELNSMLQKENREPDEEEAARLHQIKELQHSISRKFALKEAQQYASYTITKPTYIPEGYKQVEENYSLQNVDEEPVVSLDYSNGGSTFSTKQLEINQKADIELEETGFFEKPKSYSLNGFQFDYVSSKDPWVGMRVTVPEKGYKIVLIADKLSKVEMEKVLLSMIEK
ncbi:hypothetical protein F4694_006525 [Bacillus niacini]|uniref:DUF4367 domain-containing protein n=1 Tax=Neobacillus niacini TaxID=86668 RepID=A0A852TLI6_9BACI|nr:DUF4367 domain-containing protein [Neobacillus niacini]NYE09622.1 hypothetical protein [Neobacillus niacini]